MNTAMANKQYKIKVVKPEELIKYGFKEYQHPHYYEYKTELGATFYCDMEEVHRYTRCSSKIGYLVPRYPTPAFSVELAYLITNLLNAGVIEFEIITKKDKIDAEIKKVETRLENLKKERELL